MTTATNPYSLNHLNPAEWTVLGYFYQGNSPELAEAYADDMRELNAALTSVGLDWNDIVRHDNGGCAHCGARFLHGAVAYRQATGTVLAIGHTCAGERFGLTLEADLRAKYGAAKAARERIERAERFAALCGEHEGLAEAFELDHYITRDIRSYAFRFGQISEKQLALVFKLARETAEQEARRAAERAAAVPCPTGRVTITGEVMSIRENHHPVYGTTWKMTVKDDRGFRVYGTVPSALDVERGARVTFTASVERSHDDETFGFYKRPTKAAAL